VTLCSLVDIFWSLGGMYSFHHQSREINHASQQQAVSACRLLTYSTYTLTLKTEVGRLSEIYVHFRQTVRYYLLEATATNISDLRFTIPLLIPQRCYAPLLSQVHMPLHIETGYNVISTIIAVPSPIVFAMTRSLVQFVLNK
jgi:hypothetical protein